MSEGRPIGGESTGGDHYIPGLPSIDSYSDKVAELRNLEALIKADMELETKLSVDPGKGLTAPMAHKMLKDTMARLMENRKRLNKLMGRTVQ